MTSPVILFEFIVKCHSYLYKFWRLNLILPTSAHFEEKEAKLFSHYFSKM